MKVIASIRMPPDGDANHRAGSAETLGELIESEDAVDREHGQRTGQRGEYDGPGLSLPTLAICRFPRLRCRRYPPMTAPVM